MKMGGAAHERTLRGRRLQMRVRRSAGIVAGLGLAGVVCMFASHRATSDGGTDFPPPSPNSPDEPTAATLSLARTAEFLDGVALDWTRKRQCGTCHTNYAYMIGRPVLAQFESNAQSEIRSFFENRVLHWDDAEKAAKPRWDTEVVATASALAINDAVTTGKLHPLTRKALDRMWTLQKPSGEWDWLKCNWPPYEHDDYYGAAFAAVGVGHAPDGYAQADSAQEGLNRLRAYLRNNAPPDLHHATILLWASTRLDGLMDSAQRDRTITALRALERPEGGWNLPSLGTWKRHDGEPNDKDAPSDGYATGLVVYVLRQAGVPAGDPAIERGVRWLKTHQRVSGRWFTRSLSTDKNHYIANAGTAFAALALQACE
jgi:squalene-hopene/tetraprenyl-beta-curcumene cyclase